MSRIPDELLEQLQSIAQELREVFEERGYRVDSALELDSAFQEDGRSRSQLSRALVAEAFRTGASRVGADLDHGPGGSKQFRVEMDGGIGLFRLKRARRTGDTFRIVTNSSSTWAEIDDDTLLVETPWVFSYELEAGEIQSIFVAPVLEVIEGKPGYLVLGEITYLGAVGPDGAGFRPDPSDDLPGLDDTDELDFGTEVA